MYTLIISTSISELYTTTQYVLYSVLCSCYIWSSDIEKHVYYTLFFFFFYIVIGNEIKKKLHQKVIK